MLKTKAKIIIAFAITFIAICLSSTNTVQAFESIEAELQAILDAVPETMNLDIPEVEFEKAEGIILTKVKDLLEDSSIVYEDVEDGVKLTYNTINGNDIVISCEVSLINMIGEFYNVPISIDATNGETSYNIGQKTIQLTYNNTEKRNSEDETYVKTLKIENPGYYEVPIDYMTKDGSDMLKVVGDYHTKLIGDSSIIVKADSAIGCEGPLSSSSDMFVAIFKDGILYDVRSLATEDNMVTFIPAIELPFAMTEDRISDYVIELIKQYYPEYGENITSISKGASGEFSELTDIYTVNVSENEEPSIIIIRKNKTEVKLQAILDTIPETMKLDIPEVEFEKAEGIILTKVKAILKDSNIQYEDVEDGVKLKDLTIDGDNILISALYTDIINEIYNTHIYIDVINGEDSYDKLQKTIQLTYNNTEKRNSEDEKYVKNLKIESPGYYEVPLDYLLIENDMIEFKVAGEYYTKLIGDSSIIVKADAGVGYGKEGLNNGLSIIVAIFKDGILYDVRTIEENDDMEIFIPAIEIPKSIAEEDINDYAIDLIKEYYQEYGKSITSISKGVSKNYPEETIEKFSEVTDIYTVNVSENEEPSLIIIRREKTVALTDNETKIKFESTSTVVPEDTILKVEEIKEEKTLNTIKEALKEISNKYISFDISLIHNDEKIQPNGKVKISIPVPEGFDASKLVVYRIEEDGTKVEFKVEVVEKDSTKYAQFETDHFSNYVLAEKTVQQDNSDRVLDDQPKTGIFDIKLFVGIAMVIFTIVVVKNKRKNA